MQISEFVVKLDWSLIYTVVCSTKESIPYYNAVMLKKLFRSHKLSPALYPKDVRVMGAQKWDCQKMGAAHDFISGEPICSDAYFLNNKKCARFQLNLFFFRHGHNILWSSNYLRWAFKSIMGEAPIFRPVLFFTPIVLSLGCLYVYII